MTANASGSPSFAAKSNSLLNAFSERPRLGFPVAALRWSVQRGTPFGTDRWQQRTAAKLGLGYTLRPPGRPKKTPAEDA